MSTPLLLALNAAFGTVGIDTPNQAVSLILETICGIRFVCFHTRTHARGTHSRELTHIHSHTHARMHARELTHTHARTHVRARARARTHTHTHTHTHTGSVHLVLDSFSGRWGERGGGGGTSLVSVRSCKQLCFF